MIDSSDLVHSIAYNHIVLNMANWIIHECSILSYEIELFSTKTNSSQEISYKNETTMIKIGQLDPNEHYQLNVKVQTEAGESLETILFQTMDEPVSRRTQIEQSLIVIAISLFIVVSILILMKIYRRRSTQTGKLNNELHESFTFQCESFRYNYSSEDTTKTCSLLIKFE